MFVVPSYKVTDVKLVVAPEWQSAAYHTESATRTAKAEKENVVGGSGKDMLVWKKVFEDF